MKSIKRTTIDPQALAHLTLFALSKLWEQEDGCCPVHCGACYALHIMLNEDTLDAAVAPEADGYSWWVDGKVDREWLHEKWYTDNQCMVEHDDSK